MLVTFNVQMKRNKLVLFFAKELKVFKTNANANLSV